MAETSNLRIVIDAQDNASRTLKGLGKTTEFLENSFASATKVSAGLTAGLVGLGITSVKAFSAQEDAVARLTQGLTNVGDASKESIQTLLDQASALQKTTRFSDEQIISAQGMLSTFLLNSKTIKTLTPRVLDMAEALRKSSGGTIDLEQASILLGKALGSGETEGLAGALRRVGVVMTKSQEEMLKTGKMEEKLSVLTKIMDQNFGNFATAGGATTAGRLDQLKNLFGELQETIGGAIAQVLVPALEALKPTIEKATVAVQDFFDYLADPKHTVQLYALTGALAGIAAIVGIGLVVAMGKLLVISAPVLLFFAGLGAVAGIIMANWEPISKYFDEKLRPAIETFWNVARPIFESIKVSLVSIANSFVKAFGPITQKDLENIGKIIGFVLGTTALAALVALDSILKQVAFAFEVGANGIRRFVDTVKTAVDWVGKLVDKLSKIPGNINLKGLKIPGFASGGFVPGPIGSPQLVLAHGGEKILSPNMQGVNDRGLQAGGGLTINFQGPVNMDNEDRVNQLADIVLRQLNRQSELSRLGAA